MANITRYIACMDASFYRGYPIKLLNTERWHQDYSNISFALSAGELNIMLNKHVLLWLLPVKD